jgi:hypothetical protein
MIVVTYLITRNLLSIEIKGTCEMFCSFASCWNEHSGQNSALISGQVASTSRRFSTPSIVVQKHDDQQFALEKCYFD